MNIFILDRDIQQCVKYHVDKHIVKMPTETAQLLSYVYHLTEGNKTPNFLHKLQKRHIDHPCTIWTRQSINNFLWLCDFGIALFNEYQYRYDKPFKHWRAKFIFEWCKNNPPHLPNIDMTPFAKAIKKDKYPELLKIKNPVKCYRTYYNIDKLHFAKWTKRKVPYWIKKEKLCN